MRKLLKHVVLFISVLVICPWTQGMKPLTDKQLGHVVGNQPYYPSSYSSYPKNPPPDFFQRDAKRREQYVKDCYANGIKPDPKIMYGPCVIV